MCYLLLGYPGCEFQIRQALVQTIGEEKSEFFFDKVRIPPISWLDQIRCLTFEQFLEYFFLDEDAKFFGSLGLNCIRLPFNYHHFEGLYRLLHNRGFLSH